MSMNEFELPIFNPSANLRADLENSVGVTERLNQIYERYEHLKVEASLHLEPDEKQVLLSVLSCAYITPAFIEHLAQHIIDCDDYANNDNAAKTLYKKAKDASYAALLATVERLGF